MQGLHGRTIALLESRKSAELAALVQRLGGTPVVAPTVREAPHLEQVTTFVDVLVGGDVSLVVFQTGVGAGLLLSEAERSGRLADVLDRLRVIPIACRGPKPLAAIKRYGLTPAFASARPHTTRELLEALETAPLDRTVLLIHYGERNTQLADALVARGARLQEICPYEWTLPEDVAPVEMLVHQVVNGRVDAVLFTNQVQCRHLLQIADGLQLKERLIDRLMNEVIVGAVGPVSADVLKQAGIMPDVLPAAPNMPSLIAAVADYFELTDASD